MQMTKQQAQHLTGNPRQVKIFHWSSSGERRLKFIGDQIEEENFDAERTATAMSSTQPPQTCTEAVTKYYKYIVDETDEERKH